MVLASLAKRLTDGFGRFDDIDAVFDVGRIRPHSPAATLIEHCDLLVLVTRPRFDQLVPLVHQARRVTSRDIPTALVCVGDRPYSPTEMAKACQLDLLGVMTYEPKMAQALERGLPAHQRHRRLLLWRTLTEFVERIQFCLQAAAAGREAA